MGQSKFVGIDRGSSEKELQGVLEARNQYETLTSKFVVVTRGWR